MTHLYMTLIRIAALPAASTISASSNSGENWQATEREERIKERVNEAISMLNEQYQSQYVSTDWESNAFNDSN